MKRLALISFGLLSILVALPAIGFARNQVPFVNQPLLPASVAPGGPNFTLTLNGTGFSSRSVVNWNGHPRPTTFVDSTQVSAAIAASDIAAPETASVTVVNPGPTGSVSNTVFFPIVSPSSTLAFSRWDGLTGFAPVSLTSDDFNGDGKLDLAFLGGQLPCLFVLLGNGDGTFQLVVPGYLGFSGGPFSIAAADLNGDGKRDLAVVDAEMVYILFGNGDGTFEISPAKGAGDSATSLALGDFKRGGKLDLAVANRRDGTVSVVPNSGPGKFTHHEDYPTDAFPAALAVGDFNRDNILDLAVSTEAGTVSVLLGKSNGRFQPAVNFPTNGPANGVVAADFNGDGNLDLAVTNGTGNSPGSVSILLGNGDGTFQPYFGYAVALDPREIITADFNADGYLDLAVAPYGNGGGQAIQVLLGNGDGTFQPPLNVATQVGPVSLTTGDFNGDGRLDLAVATVTNGGLTILLQVPVN